MREHNQLQGVQRKKEIVSSHMLNLHMLDLELPHVKKAATVHHQYVLSLSYYRCSTRLKNDFICLISVCKNMYLKENLQSYPSFIAE